MTATTSPPDAPDRGRNAVLRRRLETERAELLAQLDRSDTPPAATATTGSGETEHIVSAVETSVQSAVHSQVEARLVEVTDALRRLEGGRYGICEQCDKEIAPARLEAMPHARLCVTCQRRADADGRSWR